MILQGASGSISGVEIVVAFTIITFAAALAGDLAVGEHVIPGTVGGKIFRYVGVVPAFITAEVGPFREVFIGSLEITGGFGAGIIRGVACMAIIIVVGVG